VTTGSFIIFLGGPVYTVPFLKTVSCKNIGLFTNLYLSFIFLLLFFSRSGKPEVYWNCGSLVAVIFLWLAVMRVPGYFRLFFSTILLLFSHHFFVCFNEPT